MSVLYVALPSLSTDLSASGVQQLCILDIFSFLLAEALVTMGGLADRKASRSASRPWARWSPPGVLDATKLAFTEGFNTVGLVGGLTLLVAAFVARRVLSTRSTVEPVETWYDEEPAAA